MGLPIGSICWTNVPTCNSQMVDFRNQTIVNVIPDGLDGKPSMITSSNGGALGLVGFTLVNGQNVTEIVQVL